MMRGPEIHVLARGPRATPRLRDVGSALVLGVGLLALALTAQAASANVIPVTTTLDEGLVGDPPDTPACGLREAVSTANADGAAGGCSAGGGDDVITVPPGEFRLTRDGVDEDVNQSGDLDVAGAPSGTLTIRGMGPGASIVFGFGDDRLIHVLGPSGDLTIEGLTLTSGGTAPSPVAGGGIFNEGTLTVRNSAITENYGALGGGGISSDGEVSVENSTISANQTGGDGAGLEIDDGTASLRNLTVTGNELGLGGLGDGGGVHAEAGAGVTLSNTIVAGNSYLAGPPLAPDCSGAIVSTGNNLIGSTAGCTFTATASDLLAVNPLLGPLAFNGGPTETHALLPGSPAIDKGAGCPATDQRGTARPQGPGCDIGAYELVLPPPPQPAAQPAAKKKCKKGFVLKKVKRKGKPPKRKCVKKKKRKRGKKG
jgi:parallel beta helix pectate lyase-like protein